MDYAVVNKKYYCGVDLGARTMYVCILSKAGTVKIHHEIPTDFPRFLKEIEPYKKNIAVCAESTFNWYWLADGCKKHSIPFYLGHALYIKAIATNKKKTDQVDSKTLAELLRTNFFPLAYAYPQKMRETRDLLRRRHRFVAIRASLARHIKIMLHQQGIYDFPEGIVKSKNHRETLLKYPVPESVAISIQHDLSLIDHIDALMPPLEWKILKMARHHDNHSLAILRCLLGIGDILSLTILYEMHSVERFKSVQNFSSYCRVVRVERSSSGKKTARKNHKIGNPYLRWAFAQLAISVQRFYPEIKTYTEKLLKKYCKQRAFTLLAHKFAVTVYYMLKNKTAFDVAKFVGA